jgi:hypothetical protein
MACFTVSYRELAVSEPEPTMILVHLKKANNVGMGDAYFLKFRLWKPGNELDVPKTFIMADIRENLGSIFEKMDVTIVAYPAGRFHRK